ncbi:hypothetical protein [Azospirillum sp. SYSU D00513]|uniref:hypothetical protein n=1 Tax=Azospirillum sp. SYSU D00513 TaxID=2812561 RepID=UPI001A95908A|nr:hypothetical protein [Azospirillum sp. SYSU D00513]
MGITSVSGIAVNRPAAPTAVTAPDRDATRASAGQADSGGYISPAIRYDQGARLAVLVFRDYDTGETRDQIPAKRVVEEYRRAATSLNREGGSGTPAAQPGGDDAPVGSPSGPASAPSATSAAPPPAMAASAPSAGTSGAVLSVTV